MRHTLISVVLRCVPFVLAQPAAAAEVQYFTVPQGDHPHDVAPAPDGTVWYTGQHTGVLGRLDPKTGEIERIPLGQGSAPHGVIVGPDGAAWVTDSGLNAIVRVDPATKAVKAWPLPKERAGANLNTAAFDGAKAASGSPGRPASMAASIQGARWLEVSSASPISRRTRLR